MSCNRSWKTRRRRGSRELFAEAGAANCRPAWWNRRRSCSASRRAAAAARLARNSRPGKPSQPVANNMKARIACRVPIFGEPDARGSAARHTRASEPERERLHVRPISRQVVAGDFVPDPCESSGVRDRHGDFLPSDCARRFESAHPQDFVASCSVRRAGLTFLTGHRLRGPFAVACKDCAGCRDSRLYARPTSIPRGIRRRPDNKRPPLPPRSAADGDRARWNGTRSASGHK
jgi:hypothetical protein